MKKFGSERRSSVKKTWRLWGMLSLVPAALGAGYLLLIPGPTSKAIAAAIADPLTILASRSPGQRAPGALTQTKAAKAVDPSSLELAGLLPTERVLSNVRSRPPLTGTPDTTVFEAPAGGGAGPDIGPVPVVDGSGIAIPLVTPVAGPIVAGGGGSGGPGGVGVIDTPGGPGTPVDTPAVPEPGTWLMMLLGFFGIGVAQRTASANGRSPARRV